MENIIKLQNLLKEKNIDAYIITNNDDHGSEFIPEHFKTIKFLTGFSGENATLIVTTDEAMLWTDGRFFLQAEKELSGKAILLMKEGEPNVPTVSEYLSKFFSETGNLGFDGRLISNNVISQIKLLIPNINLISADLISGIWNENRPNLPFSLLYTLKEFFSGTSFQDKLKKIREAIYEMGASTHIISKLEDQAWLYNLRANDIESTPVFLAYTIITNDDVHLFIDPNKIQDDVKKYMAENKINIHPYDDFYTYISELNSETILLDCASCNYTTYKTIYNDNIIIDKPNPSERLKAIKNDVEIAHTKSAHIKDGVAMVKAIYHLYQNTNELDEISFSNYLYERRKEQQGFIELSFPTIAGFRDNGAIVHYTATEESKKRLSDEERTFFLVDSGAHYAQGTTDITRTFALGPVSDDMKLHYTLVLKSSIALSTATFIKGTTGTMLDAVARNPLWQHGLNYNHGTGHGVGHILSVHEGPQRISYKINTRKAIEPDMIISIEPGMITTNEPGLYITGKYGIRIENELLCVNAFDNDYGTFYKFETLTLCPIDLKAVDVSLLTDTEISWINDYHKNVYETLSPNLSKDEASWLLERTLPITK